MSIGHFSLSLTVKDINKSLEFYKKLGFSIFAGDKDQNWLIMKSVDVTIGLFQGMFDKNMLTFNPGWDSNSQNIENFKDVRVLQDELHKKGIDLIDSVDSDSKGAGSFMIEDPDGNPILFDQHI